MPRIDPLAYISENIIWLDLLGNQSVYARGFANDLTVTAEQIANAEALCFDGLEPIMERFGRISISYGFISSDLSQKIVKYQDPHKPSHHRFDLGAAADFIAHDWIADETEWAPRTSPIALAHAIDQAGIPYSRLITYSESPYLCLALSSDEISFGRPRKAFYENRYEGRPKAKPAYTQLSNANARSRHFKQLLQHGLEHPWEGAGYPTYHGGGTQQYHHMRVSQYTMVSDWLGHLQSIARGTKNIPALGIPEVEDSFAAAGIVYDEMVRRAGVHRLPIVRGYLSHQNPYSTDDTDWRHPESLEFEVLPPSHDTPTKIIDRFGKMRGVELHENEGRVLVVIGSKEDVITSYAEQGQPRYSPSGTIYGSRS